MVSILIALFMGWLLHFVHLNDLFNYLLGFNDRMYYILFFVLGFANAMTNITKKGDK